MFDENSLQTIKRDGNEYVFNLFKKWLRTLESEGLITSSKDIEEKEKDEITIDFQIFNLICARFDDEFDEMMINAKQKNKRKKLNKNP